MRLGKIIKYGVFTIIAALLGVVLYVSGWVFFNSRAIEEAQTITAENGVHSLEAPEINGVRQWVQIRGNDARNPVIVFIHGGPLTPMMPWAHLYQQAWEQDFVVAQWDQRGVGKSRHHPETGARIPRGDTIDQYVDDAIDVIDYVRTQTGQEKVILIGHSWGSVIGLRVAQARPDLLHAYVGAGQVLDMEEAERRSNALALAEARRQENKKAIEALERIQPYPDSFLTAKDSEERSEIFMTARRWVSVLLPSGEPVMGKLIRAPFLSPAYTLPEAWRFLKDVQDRSVVNSPAFRELLAVHFPREGMTFEIPVFFIEGRQDHFTESSVVADNFSKISAPAKGFYWLENSGHFGMIQESDAFHGLLVEHVLPVAADEGP